MYIYIYVYIYILDAIDPALPAIPLNILSNFNTCILSYIYRIFLICKYIKSISFGPNGVR